MLWKCYYVFTKPIHRILQMIVLPIIVIACGMIAMSQISQEFVRNQYSIDWVLGIGYGVISIVEILMDYFSFSGIYSKKMVHMEFLKTASKGIPYYLKMILFDLLRRGCFFLLYTVVIVIMHDFRGDSIEAEEMWRLLVTMLTFFLFTSWGVFFARFWTVIWGNLLVAYIVTVLEGILAYVLGCFGNVYLGISILLLFGVLVSLYGIYKITKQKMETSYYDK